MMYGERLHITPWQKGSMPAAQVEAYRQAIAPLQRSLGAAKRARMEVFKWIKKKVS